MTADAAEPTTDAAAGGADYLTVALVDDIFALRVDRVHEVLDPPPMTLVPNAPDHAPGLINVRGNVVPLVDLRTRLRMARAENTETTRVIVSEVGRGEDAFAVGVRTDAVFEVIHVRDDEIEPIPEHGTRWPERFLSGVVKRDNRFVVLLDLERIVEIGQA